MITVYVLTSEFGSSRKCDRNNLQWLRSKDRVNGAVFVSPYAENDYFKEQFILPLLDKDGYIDEKNFGVPQITLDGASYCIKKWHKNQNKESFT